MKIKNSDTQYAGLVIAMHWLMLVVLALVYACMELRGLATKGTDLYNNVKALHFSLGLCVIGLVVLRVGARGGRDPRCSQASSIQICRDALVLSGDLLMDGHNRYAPCMKHRIPFETRQNTLFKSIDDVHLCMIENHLGRRCLSDYQHGVLALRKKEILLRARSATVGRRRLHVAA